MSLIERFLRYVAIDTQSDPNSRTFPSTKKQKDLSKLLVKELIEFEIDAFLDDFGYVYAKIPANSKKRTKSIGLLAHVDTSFDAPGGPVKPLIIKNYDGSKIQLNKNLDMSPKTFPSLTKVIGDDIIVTDGNTLLGADDKCGVAEIMEVAKFISENPSFIHGDIYICFTPDEEIGKGADHFNYNWFKADFAYTADGGEVGGIEYENFNAAGANLTFTGKSIHPGDAKNRLVNSMHIAMQFHDLLPKFLDPANTEKYEGFNHLSDIRGSVEETESHYIIRNHDKDTFNQQKTSFHEIANYLNHRLNYDAVKVEIKDSYFNMYDIVKNHMYIVELAKTAITNCGLTPSTQPIRGGTDGARLTFGGLPCPNLGTGGYNFHGRYEFCSINQMKKAVEVLLEIIKETVKL